MDNFAEKHSISLKANLERIKSTKIGFFEAELPELSYAGGNRVKFGTDTYELSPQPWQALCKYLEIPEHLLPRLGSGLGGLVFKCLKKNGLTAPKASKQIRVAYNTEGRVVSITPANLVCDSVLPMVVISTLSLKESKVRKLSTRMFQLRNQETKLLHLIVRILNSESIKFADCLALPMREAFRSEKNHKQIMR